MILYHHALLEKSEASHQVSSMDDIDMENVDYKRQPEVDTLKGLVNDLGGSCCGIIRGGMFGFATNQVWLLSAWTSPSGVQTFPTALDQRPEFNLVEQGLMEATVRPETRDPIRDDGIHVVRWIRMRTGDIEEYTQLCLETWPMFEKKFAARCYGVFRDFHSASQDTETVSRILMLTWYGSLEQWEKSRDLFPRDQAKWARRSELELSHWAQAGRPAREPI